MVWCLVKHRDNFIFTLVGWKTLDTQNNSLIIDLWEDEDLDDHERDHWMDTVVRQKQVIYWPNFVTRRETVTP
jgi:hypothetical protein